MCLGFVVTMVYFSLAQGSNSTGISSLLVQELVCQWFYLSICSFSSLGLPFVQQCLIQKESSYMLSAFSQQKIAISYYSLFLCLVMGYRKGIFTFILIQPNFQEGTNQAPGSQGQVILMGTVLLTELLVWDQQAFLPFSQDRKSYFVPFYQKLSVFISSLSVTDFLLLLFFICLFQHFLEQLKLLFCRRGRGEEVKDGVL